MWRGAMEFRWSRCRQLLHRPFALMIATADGIIHWRALIAFSMIFKKIDRLMPIVAETEQIADRRNLCLKSRAQFSDGSERRFFVARRKNLRC
jgi:hypothetical protein